METPRRKILVVLGGLGRCVHPEHTAELATHLCEGRRGELVLAYPIVVHQALALDAPLPEQEAAAAEAIERGRRGMAGRDCTAQVRIVRHRHAAEAILELARAEQVSTIVLGMRLKPNVPPDYDPAKSAEGEILRRAECEVIVVREPIAA
jgi:nucleotide-binding universal stress UspA family protein